MAHPVYDEMKKEERKHMADFKVRCVKSYFPKMLIEGKVYEIKNGQLTFEDGRKSRAYRNFEELQKHFVSKFELVEDESEGKPKQFTKADLETGMRVKLRNGDTHIILQNVQTEHYGFQDIFLAQQDGFGCGSHINNDLTWDGDSDLDIIEVYDKPSNSEILDETKFGKLIWTRHEPLYYTIAEAEAALTEAEGREVKIRRE